MKEEIQKAVGRTNSERGVSLGLFIFLFILWQMFRDDPGGTLIEILKVFFN